MTKQGNYQTIALINCCLLSAQASNYISANLKRNQENFQTPGLRNTVMATTERMCPPVLG